MSAELRFLLQCARSLDTKGGQPGAGTRLEVDPATLLGLAEVHGMEPALYRFLTSSPRSELLEATSTIQRRNAEASLSATAELVSVVASFESAGIPVMVHKGPVLALQLYGDVGARRFTDLDILVQPAGVPAAIHVLESRGYTAQPSLHGWQLDAYIRAQKEIEFIHGTTHQEVDLQWAFTPGFFGIDWDMANIWERSTEVAVGPSRVSTLGLNDLVLVQCVHGATHLWERLSWIADLGQLVVQDKIDWPWVLREARRIKAERIILVGVALADALTGCGVPEHIEAHMTPAARQLAHRLRRRMLSGKGINLTHAHSPFHWTLVQLRDRPSEQLLFAYHLAATPTGGDWDVVHLPRPLRFLYFLIRPFRLLLRYLPKAVRSVAGRHKGGVA